MRLVSNALKMKGINDLIILFLITCLLHETVATKRSVSTDSETELAYDALNNLAKIFTKENALLSKSDVKSNILQNKETKKCVQNCGDTESTDLGVKNYENKQEMDKSMDPMVSYLARHRRMDEWELKMTCDICEMFIEMIQNMLKNATAVNKMAEEVIKMCLYLKIDDERICKMTVAQFQIEVLYVIENLVLKPQEACGILLGDACATPYFPGEMWNVTFPNTTKPIPRPPALPQAGAPTIRFLHLSDIHIDFMYREGSSVKCGEPLCCRPNDNFTGKACIKENDRAGRYGQLDRCDAPENLIINLFQNLRAIQNTFDYVIFTGDIPAHDVWNQSRSDQIEHFVTLDRLFTQYLPTKPVFSCIGNHESSPIASFPPPGVPNHDLGWLYGAMASIWGKWLPQTALDTILRCGGYSVSPLNGFRIISINNNYCNNANWWLLLNSTDPCDVLQWLIQELQSAEDKGEKVHILMHIPPGIGTCLKYWSHNFYSIVNRYENTIVNQFYGHTHRDSFEMFYDEETLQRPLGVAFITPSVTPFTFNNPVYRIYTMDGNYQNSSWAVLNYTSYFLNLTEANLYDDLKWTYEYSPKETYNMTSLYAADWENLLQRMETDDNLFQSFYRYNQNLYPQPLCENVCKQDLLCSIKEARSYDPDICQIHH